MEFSVNPEDEAFRQTARAWLRDNIPREPRPSAPKPARAFDLAWQRLQHDAGWAGISWPREHGGRGLPLAQQMIWYEESARAGAPPVGCLQIALNHAGPTLIVAGTDAQKQFHLPRILRGDVVWCQGFSEPGAGSDLASLRTRAVVDGSHLVVSGQKVWTSFAHQADYQELLVRTSNEGSKHRGLTWVICDMRLPGIEVRPIDTLAGDQHFNEVFYDEVRIPIDNVVGEIGEGWKVAMSTLSFERGTTALGHSMHLGETVERLVALARECKGPDGRRPAIEDEEIADRVATLRTEAAALRAMNYATASRSLREPIPGPEGAMVWLYYGELIQRVRRTALDILGKDSMAMEGLAGTWVKGYLEELKYTIGGGTSEIRRNIIAERVLGLPRSY